MFILNDLSILKLSKYVEWAQIFPDLSYVINFKHHFVTYVTLFTYWHKLNIHGS